jgi:hypothetical protein
MSSQRPPAPEKAKAQRPLTAKEQQILRTSRQILVIQQQIASLSKGRQPAA